MSEQMPVRCLTLRMVILHGGQYVGVSRSLKDGGGRVECPLRLPQWKAVPRGVPLPSWALTMPSLMPTLLHQASPSACAFYGCMAQYHQLSGFQQQEFITHSFVGEESWHR